MFAQENVLSESMMMVPETRQRLEAAYNDLQSFVVRTTAWLGVKIHVNLRHAQVRSGAIRLFHTYSDSEPDPCSFFFLSPQLST